MTSASAAAGHYDARFYEVEKAALSKTFLLNSNDFVKLHEYLAHTTQISAPDKPQAENTGLGLDEFSNAEQELCDMMKSVLPRITHNTTKFRINTLEPMVSLGARTGDKSDSQERLNSLADTIKKLHSHPAESSEFQEGRENALTALKALRDHADQLQKNCGQITGKLAAVSTGKNIMTTCVS